VITRNAHELNLPPPAEEADFSADGIKKRAVKSCALLDCEPVS